VSTDDPEVLDGYVDAGVAEEFPALRVAWVEVPATVGPSPPELRERLRGLSDRLRGAQAIALRGQDVPHAYRVFFRHIGLDPDVDRIPVEALMLERLFHGGYPSRGRLPDALSIACIETGVPVWAVDAERVAPPFGVRPAREGDSVPAAGAGAPPAAGESPPTGQLVLADADRSLAVLFQPPGPPWAPDRETRRVALVSVVVPGVPALFAEEALWIAGEALAP
jgi:DNA/RNA-binding domain of Phe-tRNA-synthetase-like protein